MDINLVRLQASMNNNREKVKQEDDFFLENINLFLSDSDHVLKENVKDSPFTFILIETGGTEELFKREVYKKYPEPYYLISTGKNNSLPATLEIKTFLELQNLDVRVITGNEEQIAYLISKFSHIQSVFFELKENNLGLVGEPSDWLIASKVSIQDVYDKYRFNIVKIPMEEFFNEIQKHQIEPTSRREELENKWKDKAVLNEALEIYGALKRLVKKYRLNGLSVRCFDLVEKYKNTSCLALALLNDEGITAGCEGDIPSLMTMHIVSHLANFPVFMANPSTVDFSDQSLILSHCTIPLKMTNSYALDTHFESGLGLAIKGEMRPGEVTIAKISPDLNSLFLAKAEIKENLSLPHYCRTQIKVIFEEGLKDFMEISFGNHLIISYGDLEMEFLSLIKLFYEAYGKKKISKKKVSS